MIRFIWSTLLFGLVAISTPISAQDQTNTLPQVYGAEERSALVNFHEVNAELFRSGKLSEAAVGELEEKGVRTIISLEDYEQTSARNEESWALAAGMNWQWLPMSGFLKPTLPQIYEALTAIENAESPVLIHCLRGSDRTGIVAAAWRIRHDGWSVEQAIQEMRRLGHLRALYWWDDILYEVE